jgi:hypothetical protein
MCTARLASPQPKQLWQRLPQDNTPVGVPSIPSGNGHGAAYLGRVLRLRLVGRPDGRRRAAVLALRLAVST